MKIPMKPLGSGLSSSPEALKDRWIQVYNIVIEEILDDKVAVDKEGDEWYITIPADYIHVYSFVADMAGVFACGLENWTQRIDVWTDNTGCIEDYPQFLCPGCKRGLISKLQSG